MRIIFITGQSGSGKDTQASKIIYFLENSGKKVLSLNNGVSIRGWDSGSWFSEIIKENNKTGNLAPKIAVNYLAIKKIEEFGKEKPDFVIWNGSPRDTLELDILKEFIIALKNGFDDEEFKAEVLVLNVSDEVCLYRIKKRNQFNLRPETSTDLSIKNKLSFYNKKTLGSLALIKDKKQDYKNFFKIREVNGNNLEEEVFQAVLKKLDL